MDDRKLSARPRTGKHSKNQHEDNNYYSHCNETESSKKKCLTTGTGIRQTTISPITNHDCGFFWSGRSLAVK